MGNFRFQVSGISGIDRAIVLNTLIIIRRINISVIRIINKFDADN